MYFRHLKVSPILIFDNPSFHLCTLNSQKETISSQYLIKLKPQPASRHFELFSRQQHDGKFHSFYSEFPNKRVLEISPAGFVLEFEISVLRIVKSTTNHL